MELWYFADKNVAFSYTVNTIAKNQDDQEYLFKIRCIHVFSKVAVSAGGNEA